MLFLFRGRYRIVAQLLIGAALIAVGILAHAVIATVIGAVLAAWGLYNAVVARRRASASKRSSR